MPFESDMRRRNRDAFTRCQSVDFGPRKHTRFHELGYQRQGSSWRFLDLETGSAIGGSYSTRLALLDDLERFAMAFGCLETVAQP